jgi:hypothetical protein
MKSIAESKPDVVIVAQNLTQSTKQFRAISEKLNNIGAKRIVFVGPTPHWITDLPRIAVRRLWPNVPNRTYAGIDQDVLSADSRLKKAFEQSDGRSYVSIIDLFCNLEGCLTYIGQDKIRGITTWDYGHLTPAASDFLAKTLLVKLLVDGTSTPR